jgi:hypothetical protein
MPQRIEPRDPAFAGMTAYLVGGLPRNVRLVVLNGAEEGEQFPMHQLHDVHR